MGTKLFIMLPYYSHITPTFGLASFLKEKGEKVIYANDKAFKDLIIGQGFNFMNFSYLMEYRVKDLKTFFGLFFISILDKRFKVRRYLEFLRFANFLERTIKIFKPSAIFLDEYIAEYYLILIKTEVPVTILNTRCSTLKKKNIPPLNSLYIPKQNILSTLYCEFLWSNYFLIQKINEFTYFTCFLGVTETFFWRRILAQNNLKYSKIISNNHCLNKSINKLQTINLVPQSFEFLLSRTGINENYLHIPHRINLNSKERDFYIQLKNRISYRKSKGQKILVTSFGTLYDPNSEEIKLFHETLIQIISEINNLFLIIISKRAYKETENVNVFDFIPLSNLIEYVDLMINHGGIGIIKECMEYNIPMIVVPLNFSTDQPGCSARIKSHKLGSLLNIKNYTKLELKNLIINHITEN
jgi:UDP:flavonoid glycosyltransferase YjiC (YdhE family)